MILVSVLLTLGAFSSHKLSPAAQPSKGYIIREGVLDSVPAQASSLGKHQLCRQVCQVDLTFIISYPFSPTTRS
eukprot:IDg20649t1